MKATPARLRFRRFGSSLFWMVPLLAAGCGITATKSFSPLDFFMPGLLKAEPPQSLAPQSTNILLCVRISPLALSDAALR